MFRHQRKRKINTAQLEMNCTDIMEWADTKQAAATLDTLHFNCLLRIFDYLDAESLLALCEASAHFEKCILHYNHILGNKWFRMFNPEHSQFMPTFERYGSSIRKLEFDHYAIQRHGVDKFNFFVKTIVDFLTPDNLTHLHINFPIRTFNRLLMRCARPFFRNLVSFSFGSDRSDVRKPDLMLAEIIGHAERLRELSVYNTHTTCSWLHFKHLLNLEKFTLRFNRLTTTSHLEDFFARQPRLKSFIFSAPLMQRQMICRWVTKYTPMLEEFKIANTYMEMPHGDDFDYSDQPFRRRNGFLSNFERALMIDPFRNGESDDDDDLDGTINLDDADGHAADDEHFGVAENVEILPADSDDETDDEFDVDFLDLGLFMPVSFNWKQIYSGLAQMPCLKRLWLRSYFDSCMDLVDVLNVLARRGTIEELTVQNQQVDFRPAQPLKADDAFACFASINSFRFISPSVRALPFLERFVSAMPNARQFVVDADEECVNVCDTLITIVERAGNVEVLVLKMPPSYFTHLLYIKLLRVQQAKRATRPLQIYISSVRQKLLCQWLLGGIYDEEVIAIKCRSFTDWYENPL